MKKEYLRIAAFTIIAFILGMLLNKPLVDFFNKKQSGINVGKAHTYSKNFRTLENYCSGQIDSRRLGYFRISYTTAKEMLNAMSRIRQSTIPTSDEFHCIFGSKTLMTSNKQSIIILAGLKPDGKEWLEDPSGNPIVQELSNPLPCPRHCDISKSDIIMGSASDACR